MHHGLDTAFVLAGDGADVEIARWIEQVGLSTLNRANWYVEVSIPSEQRDTRCELDVYPAEWRVIFRRGLRVSSVRVTDVAAVRGRDDDRLLNVFPSLDRFRNLLTLLEHRFDLAFDRTGAVVSSNLVRAAPILRSWLLARV